MCFTAEGCGFRIELCSNGTDDNGDGNTDCADPMCADPMCAGQVCGPGCICAARVKAESDCGDTMDNDGDGFSDCSDSDCALSTACRDGGAGGGSGGGVGGPGGGGGGGAGGGAGANGLQGLYFNGQSAVYAREPEATPRHGSRSIPTRAMPSGRSSF